MPERRALSATIAQGLGALAIVLVVVGAVAGNQEWIPGTIGFRLFLLGLGLGVVTLAVLLICLNLYDGIRRISRSKHHVVMIIALVLVYLFLSARVVEMAWDFRDLQEQGPVVSAPIL